MRSLIPALFLMFSAPALAATYEVDAAHSQVGFSVSHMMVSKVRGHFGTVTGVVEYDPANVAATKVNGKVGIASVDTANADRDKHLVSPDFFDVAKFPEMTFVSKGVRNVTATTFDLVGDLTLRGVTREVVFRVNKLAADVKDPWGNTKSGTTATTVLNRQDFGVAWNTKLDTGGYVVGDEVAVTLELELTRK
jgi:polyisoprenoid-binding protein YceI